MEIDPFDIRALVPEVAEIEAELARASSAARDGIRCRLDVAYGDGPDERLDLFFPEAAEGPCPVHLFIHGGFWRANRKEAFGFVAGPVVAAGAIAAIADYSLMPRARMRTLAGQVRRAATWLVAHGPEFGADPSRLTASGHSAGAHLASYLAARAPHEAALPEVRPRALLLVSGIYDLAPITRSFLQTEIALDYQEVRHWSPLEAEQATGPLRIVAVGEAETAPFRAQAEAFCHHAPRWELAVIPGLNHMTILAEMGRPGSAMAQLLTRTVRA